MNLADIQSEVQNRQADDALVSTIQGWLSPAEQHVLYQLTAESAGAILEIGAWVGLSTACIALGIRENRQPRLFLTAELNPKPENYRRVDSKIGFFLEGDIEPRGYSSIQDFRRYVKPVIRRPQGAIGALRRNLTKLGLINKVTIWDGHFRDAPDFNYRLVFCDATHTPYEISRNLPSLCRFLRRGSIVAFHDTDASNRSKIENYITFQEAIQVDSLFVCKVSTLPHCEITPRSKQDHTQQKRSDDQHPASAQINVSHPTISVILPTYNRAHVLARAILSVLNQEYDDFELIVIDDASTDETCQVVQSFEDTRIRYIRHPQNRGAAAARNTGIHAARGRYLAFQDSDDEWLPEKLARQVASLSDSPEKTGVAYSRCRLFNPNGTSRILPSRTQLGLRHLPFNIYHLEHDIYPALTRGNFVTTQSVLMKKKCIETVGMFDESLSRFQDWDLWLRIAQHYEFMYNPHVLVNIYRMEESLSTNQAALWEAFAIIVPKHKGRPARRLQAHSQFATGHIKCQRDDLENGRKRLWRAVKLSPFTLRYWETALLALFGGDLYKKAVKYLKIGYLVR
jgi:glycosyltransferase involved in cell wall biosynthesis